jgi:hypothetical protein
MKIHPVLLLLLAVLLTIPAVQAQSTPPAAPLVGEKAPPPPTDAQRAFELMKALAGNWEGKMPDGQTPHGVIRATSRGTALLFELKTATDNPITMIHLDGDRIMLTHYCDAGNQPRMVGKLSADGKTVAFDFLDATNLQNSFQGHMHAMSFTPVDANHFTWDVVFHFEGKPPMKATVPFQRVSAETAER